MTIKVYPTLYKIDTKGKLREWHMETDGARFRTVSGLADGKHVTSEWKETFPTNEGKVNARTAEEQATAEVLAEYQKRRDGEYHDSPDQANGGSIHFKPMLADKWENRKDKTKYPVYVQPKLDGLRLIATKHGLFSRTGKKFVSTPHIQEALAPLFNDDPDLILDGELYNHEYKDDFNKIISLTRKTKPSKSDLDESARTIQYHVYDVPSVKAPFADRLFYYLEILKRLNHSAIVPVSTISAKNEDEVDEIYSGYIVDGYEGGIIRINGDYENKRSKNLLKRKDFQDQEFTIVRIEEGQGNWSSFAKKLIIQLPDGSTQHSGLEGSQEYLRQVLAEKDDYIGGEATVCYFQKTPDGKLRFPVAKTLFKKKRDI